MWYWLLLLLLCALVEFVAWRRSGSTLSQHLWRSERRFPFFRWLVLGFMVLLTIHLVFGWP